MTQTFLDVGIDLGGKRGKQVKVKCPECQGDRKNHRSDTPLSVNTEEQIWNCHHCGWHGALEGRHPHYGERPTYQRPNLAQDRRILPRGRHFLENRGIDPDVAERVQVYSNPDDTALAFPYTRHGEIIHVKYRSIDDKRFWSTKDTERTAYGYDQCDGAETILIVEGELDRLAILTAGFTPVCSVPDGAPNENDQSGSKMAWLLGCEDLFTNARKVVVAVDADPNGRRLAEELTRRIGPEKCWNITWPEDCKDANDVLIKHGAERLTRIIDNARPEPVAGIEDGNDMVPDLINLYRNGGDKGWDFGYPEFDKIYTVLPGYVTIVTGHPGHGKSTALDQLLVRLVQRFGIHLSLFSPEQQPNYRHQKALIQQYTGMPFDDGPTPRMTEKQMLEANQWLAQYFSFITPESPDIDTVINLAKVQIYRTGAKGIVIDPWNEIEHARPAKYSETEYVSMVLGKIRQFARNSKVHVWLVAHPTKMQRNEDGSEKVPTLQDVTGSYAFRAKADFGLTVWRDARALTNPVDILVTKSRFEDVAQIGRVQFQFTKANRRLTEVGVVN